ncbi:MAG: hypothetical protein J0L86_07145 [Flavobacteriales bacterium]|nr:hypothetical protein [Flavobacteriales bacterium]
MGTLLFALMGWCGTKWPGWWRGPKPPQPDPEPWWRFGIAALGIAAGIGGGLLFKDSFANDQFFAGQVAIASSLAAFGVANVVTGVASAMRG